MVFKNGFLLQSGKTIMAPQSWVTATLQQKKYCKQLVFFNDDDLVAYKEQEIILRHTGNHYRNHFISVGNHYGHN